ncbi:MAG: hypothetical protein ACRC8T_07160 [Acidaminococcaceae bacterium]
MLKIAVVVLGMMLFAWGYFNFRRDGRNKVKFNFADLLLNGFDSNLGMMLGGIVFAAIAFFI